MIVIEDIINNIAISVNEISDDITISVSETSNLVNIEVSEIGLKGDKGDKGDTGDVVNVGVKGDTGEQGIQGIQGIQGEAGAQGLQGLQGLKGDAGEQGLQGIKGDTGLAGANGIDGLQGLKGDTGSIGATGATGLQGAQGLQGIAGNDGAAGVKGDTGLQGIQGITGAKGDTGTQGATGTQGIQGLTGANGTNGIDGAQGIQGIQGIKGDTGAAGVANVAGANTQIQFNNAGVFGGSSDFTWDDINNTLGINGVDSDILLKAVTNEPTTPATDTGLLYAKYIGGKFAMKIKGASGLDSPLQNAFWQNNITMWNPTNVTAGVWLGSVGAVTGTFSRAMPTSTSTYTSIVRSRYANVVTTLNQVLGVRNTELMFTRGSVTSQGGFFLYTRCGFDAWTNGGRFFAGMHSGTTVISADPSALNNTVGFCVDAADNGVISFLTRGTVATKASTGFTIVSNKGYDLYMFCAPNSTQISWRIVDINTGTEVNGIATTNLPANTTMLTAGVLASNAALTTVTATQLGVNRIYIETDY